jgi:hypothetical protein
MGKPIVRKLSGTDAFNLDTRMDVNPRFKFLDKFISKNITSEHKGIIVELARHGIKGELVLQVLGKKVSTKLPPIQKLIHCVLIYLPSLNKDFYHAELMKNVIVQLPEVHFIILADTEHPFSDYANVDSLG